MNGSNNGICILEKKLLFFAWTIRVSHNEPKVIKQKWKWNRYKIKKININRELEKIKESKYEGKIAIVELPLGNSLKVKSIVSNFLNSNFLFEKGSYEWEEHSRL